MIGSLLAGIAESPRHVDLYQYRRYKIYREMGSLSVMKEGGKDHYFQSHIEEDEKFIPEGIEGRVPYLQRTSLRINLSVCWLLACRHGIYRFCNY